VTNSTTVQEPLKKIAQFVQNYLREQGNKGKVPEPQQTYRWQHTLRVAQYGHRLAKAEGANVELVVAGCLLHDIAVFNPGDRKNHGRLGSKIARPFLRDLGYSEEETENICYSVACHVDVQNPDTLEAKIVTDSDNIDRFGAFRVIFWCIEDINDYEELIRKIRKRLERLEGYRRQDVLETKTGRALFNKQLDLQIQFFKALIKESDITILPQID
jgi:uncharacterized protein